MNQDKEIGVQLSEEAQRPLLNDLLRAAHAELSSWATTEDKSKSILRAFAAVADERKKQRSIVDGFLQDGKRTYFWPDTAHIVATAVQAKSDEWNSVIDISDYHPYADISLPYIAFCNALSLMEALSHVDGAIDGISDGQIYGADGAGAVREIERRATGRTK